jgi:hypothetical protein
MSWVDRLLRRYRAVSDWSELGAGRVRVRGRAEPGQLLADPIEGRPVVAVEYRAWPPATTIGADGRSGSSATAFQIGSRQAVDFELVDDAGRRLEVKVDAGDDVVGLHARLLEEYGVGLRADVEIIEPGDDVQVEGVLQQFASGGSPHRTEPVMGTLTAHRFWRVVPK